MLFFEFNVFLERCLSFFMTKFNCFCLIVLKFIFFGKYCRIRPLIFSFNPPLPGRIGMDKIEPRIKLFGNSLMFSKLFAVIRDIRIHPKFHFTQQSHNDLSDVAGRLTHAQSRNTSIYAHSRSPAPLDDLKMKDKRRNDDNSRFSTTLVL